MDTATETQTVESDVMNLPSKEDFDPTSRVTLGKLRDAGLAVCNNCRQFFMMEDDNSHGECERCNEAYKARQNRAWQDMLLKLQ